jgi:NAD(P)H-hydrate repair Nnr-like enzyme with NAD(P)H-hydrate dehydratase domain
MSPVDAAWAGAYLHGLAGILAGRETGEGTVASDVAVQLPHAVARVLEGA